MRKLTLSKVGLAAHCLYQFRDDVEVPSGDTNEFAVIGTEFGNAVACAVLGRPIPSMSETAGDYFDQWCASYTLADFGMCMPEVAMALNVVTGQVKFLGVEIGRAYGEHGAGPNDVCGSIDLACIKEDGGLYVYEWKSGRQFYLERYNNPQCRGYGALLAKYLGFREVTCITVVINADGVREYVERVVDIDANLSYIMNLAERIDLEDPQPVAGSHCKESYCQLAGVCPATNAAREALATTVPVPLATKQDVARTLEKIWAAEAQIAAMKKMIDARVEEMGEDIPLSNGKTYGLKATTRESIVVTGAAHDVLARHGLQEAVKVSLTKEAIKGIAKTRAVRGKAASLEREILDDLREADCIRVSETIGFGVKNG